MGPIDILKLLNVELVFGSRVTTIATTSTWRCTDAGQVHLLMLWCDSYCTDTVKLNYIIMFDCYCRRVINKYWMVILL